MEAHNEKHHQEEEDDQTSHTLGPLSPIYLQKQRPDSPMDTPSNSCLSTPSEGNETPSKSQRKYQLHKLLLSINKNI